MDASPSSPTFQLASDIGEDTNAEKVITEGTTNAEKQIDAHSVVNPLVGHEFDKVISKILSGQVIPKNGPKEEIRINKEPVGKKQTNGEGDDSNKLYYINTSLFHNAYENLLSKAGKTTARKVSQLMKRYQLCNYEVKLVLFPFNEGLKNVDPVLVETAALYIINCFSLHPLILSVRNLIPLFLMYSYHFIYLLYLFFVFVV